MGREVRRVPLDFAFSLNGSFADSVFDAHCASCPKGPAYSSGEHDECEYPSWRESVPKGDGWQLWQTVSDGPISPVFDTPEKLIEWMCVPVQTERQAGPWAQGWKRDVAEPFVMRQMRSPSFVLTRDASGRETLQTGAEASVGKVAP